MESEHGDFAISRVVAIAPAKSEAGLKILYDEEKLEYYAPNQHELMKEVARLEAENAALWERIKKLDDRIGELQWIRDSQPVGS